MRIDYDLIEKINDEIYDNDDYYNEEYYQVLCKKAKNLQQYISKYNITDPLTKVILGQEWMDYDLVKEELQKISLSESQFKRFEKIKSNNNAWYETMNPLMLDDKYSFLDKYMDFITTDIRIQQLILSLDDNSLNLFSKMYEKIDKETSNAIPYISRILGLIGTSVTASLMTFQNYNGGMFRKKNQSFSNLSLAFQNEQLTEHDLDLLIFIFSNNNFDFNVNSISDLRGFENELLDFVNESMNNFKNQSGYSPDDINNIKSTILMRSFGIQLDYAKSILEKFNLNGIEFDKDNNYISMYRSIYNVVNETDVNKLFTIYDNISNNCEFSLDYMTISLFENGMRDIFLRHLTSSTFKCDGNNYEIQDGVKIFDAGTDFKVILTSVGAYKPEMETQLNYSQYWNSNSIRSHGNCCSLIANNNLSTATIRNICLGFSNFEDGMLLLSGSNDLNSTPTSRQINSQDHFGKFMSANSLIDNTRSDYNELVFERRDLSSTREHYKKNPDYVVMFEELIDNDVNNQELDEETKQLLSEQERIKGISLKAAQDFDIPIVKINREKCAVSELFKINKMVEEFYQTHKPALLTRIVVDFENNRMGLRYPHNYLREKYFSKVIINKLLAEIINDINAIEDIQLKTMNMETLKNSILNEKHKIEQSENFIKHSQELGIDCDSLIEMIDNSLISEVDKRSGENRL
ncbi:unknown [Clostridium sp. CAG:628]|nr:unknown [Clostridium sp. CAG:628]